ncbi:hypothetical protein RHMOL_Rhmol04G0310500 [Rhododendron molle]|uniref:Uncharacterized protein n=1 Tax=Rhododendron molle TaxID=49168 RepID=A0ACC0P7T3_RHOML|nr:hypothetical protein RHMOL_Rhmol04G0310500 [Rhododendron molle]
MKDEVMHLFREIPQRGLKPAVETFNIVLEGLFRVGRCAAAHRLFDEMQVAGIIPSTLTFSIFLDGLCKNGHIAFALSLFHTMESNRTYNIMIGGFCYEGLLNKAKEFFVEMEQKGFFPDGCTYNVIIRGFLARKYSEALVLLKEMVAKGFPADASTVSWIVNLSFVANGRMDITWTGWDSNSFVPNPAI